MKIDIGKIDKLTYRKFRNYGNFFLENLLEILIEWVEKKIMEKMVG